MLSSVELTALYHEKQVKTHTNKIIWSPSKGFPRVPQSKILVNLQNVSLSQDQHQEGHDFFILITDLRLSVV